MRNGRLVSYRTIASSLQRDFPFVTETISDEEVIEWLGAFMGLTNAPVMLSDQTAFLELCDGKAPLPCDLHLIMQVARTDADTLADGPCSTLSPMRWTTDKFHRRYHDSDGDFQVNSPYTYTFNDNYIFPNFNDGILAMAYKAIPTDDEGFPMIPADEQWVQAAIHDVAWKSARKLWYSNKISTDKFQKLEQDRDWYFSQAVTFSRIPGIDQREGQKNHRLRSFTDVNYHNDFFRNYQLPEQRYFKGQYFNS